MSRQLVTITILIVSGLLAIIAGCSEDCPTCPTEPTVEHYRGYLYYAEYNPSFYSIYKLDMETDSIVDSLELPLGEDGGVFDVSSDGKWLAVRDVAFDFYAARTWLYDARDFSLVGEVPTSPSPHFDLARGWIVGSRADSHSTYVTVLTFPAMSLVYEDTVDGFIGLYLDRERGYFYGIGSSESDLAYKFFRYDYVNRQLEEISIIYPNGDTIQVIGSCLDSKRKRVFFKGIAQLSPTSGLAITGAYDLEHKELLWTHSMMTFSGGLAVSPDGNEVYVTDSGPGMSSLNPGAFFVFDAHSGTLLQAISTYGYRDNPYSPLSTTDAIFSPTGEKAYVAAGGQEGRQGASLLVVDTKTRNITKIISSDLSRIPRNLRIVPKN